MASNQDIPQKIKTVTDFIKFLKKLDQNDLIYKYSIVQYPREWHYTPLYSMKTTGYLIKPDEMIERLEYFYNYLGGTTGVPHSSAPPLFRIHDLWFKRRTTDKIIYILKSPVDLEVKELDDFQKKINLEWVNL